MNVWSPGPFLYCTEHIERGAPLACACVVESCGVNVGCSFHRRQGSLDYDRALLIEDRALLIK